MLIFNEGLPRAGKSYDAVVTHILPALKKGRKVFARLNGLDHEKIAAYLGMDVDDVRSLLVVVSEEDMPRIHKLVEPDSLVVIDECHKYYVQSLKALHSEVETFFAEHGQSGMDILFISQWYKRLHAAIRARVERKTVFQKLTAVGMKGSYVATFYHTTGPDKFEKVGSGRKKYDPAIFPLYHGYKPDSSNVEVYEEGSITVWKTVGPKLLIAGILLVVGGFLYARFFLGGAKPKTPPAAHVAAPSVASVPVVPKVAPASPGKPEDKPKHAGMPPEVAYLWSLNDQGRARLAGDVVFPDGHFTGVVEWRGSDQQRVLDSLTIDQIRALGVTVFHRAYGLRLSWGKGKKEQVIIVTAWPIDQVNQYTRQDVQNIRDQSPAMAIATPGVAASPVASAALGAGGLVGGMAERPRATAVPYVPPEYGEWESDPFGGKSGH